MPELDFQVNIRVNDLATRLSNSLTQEEIINLILEIDRIEADYDFTKKLHDYFMYKISMEDSHDSERESES